MIHTNNSIIKHKVGLSISLEENPM